MDNVLKVFEMIEKEIKGITRKVKDRISTLFPESTLKEKDERNSNDYVQKQREVAAVLQRILDEPSAEGLEINLKQLKDIIDVVPETSEFKIKRFNEINEQNQVRQTKN